MRYQKRFIFSAAGALVILVSIASILISNHFSDPCEYVPEPVPAWRSERRIFQPDDPLVDKESKLLFIDSTGVKWYEFGNFELPLGQARAFCNKLGLEIPNGKHVRKVLRELNTNNGFQGMTWADQTFVDNNNIPSSCYHYAFTSGQIGMASLDQGRNLSFHCVKY